MPPLKVHIVSDGTPLGTHITNADTGEAITNVIAIRWSAGVDSPSIITMSLVDARGSTIDVVGETEQETDNAL